MFDQDKYIKLINCPIRELRGIGTKRAEAFSRLGIYTAGDLIEHFPRAYQNRGNVRLLSDGIEGEDCSYLLTIGTQPKSATLKNRKVITKFTAFDESGTVVITYFNSRFIEKSFQVGQLCRFWGRIKRESGRLTMTSPSHEITYDGERLADFTPVYPSVSGLSQGIISEAVNSVAEQLKSCGVPEILPDSIRKEMALPSRLDAYLMIHSPKTREDIEKSRLAFTVSQVYVFALGLAVTRGRKRSGIPPKMSSVSIDDFRSLLGFELTGAQERSIKEIQDDMINADVPMSRLLSGDVGSGKTAVAAAAIVTALKNGYQAALMAPTEILASQHYADLSEILGKMGYRTGLLIGSTGVSEKKRLRTSAANGEIDLLIGTHSLITSDTVFDNLGLVITDEQHRFGVRQRADLGRENIGGNSPHVLVMSATPIPRTLALILYGELSLSTLDEMPKGRQRVDTFTVDESYRERLNGFIRKQVSEGGQVYIVCPTVESKENEDENGDLLTFGDDGKSEFNFEKAKVKSAVEYCEELKNDVFPDFRIGLLHGRMNGTEKDNVMSKFASGDIDILVSTTVIEVGVNVPNASLMIVENAERFGLSQLHQLRGRVGRGQRKAYCVLVSSGGGDVAKKRLSVMKSTYDGYKIAEYDLEIRGPGDYFPSKDGKARQHGSFGCMMAADMGLFKKMMNEAEKTVLSDPTLSKPENITAAGYMRALFSADERAMQ